MSNRPRWLLNAAAILFIAPAVSAQPAADAATVRDEFVAAMQRIRAHQPDLPDSSELQSYAIYDYLLAARMRRDLTVKPDENLDSAVDGFLHSHAGQPVTRGLRHDWLASLAQRRRWDWFLPRSVDTADPLLSCDRLSARLATGDTRGLAAAALIRWLVPQKPPAECTEVFGWLRQQGLLTPALAETRTRAALAADTPRLAREFAADVPVDFRAALLQWSDLLDAPKSALTVLATHPRLSVEPEALGSGFEKLARTDPASALDLLPRLLEREGMSAELQDRLRRAAALGAAYDRDPRALNAFDDLPRSAIDDQVQEWRVRAALWNHDYQRALTWIEQMPQNLATQPRWRYWFARATAATKGDAAAVTLFGEIAGLRDYYGYLAADRLAQPYSLNVRPSPPDAAAQAALARQPGMIRAHELFECDLGDDATAEWNLALGNADNTVKVQAALLASHWGWFAQSITTLAQTGEFDDVTLRYPRPFLDAVGRASRLAQLPQDWILAIMRQESLFRKDAVSHADARGVMQIVPSTAAAIARRWHLAVPGRDALFDPSIAIPLGAAYMRELLDRYGEQLALCLAAYNAGPAAVARWLPPAPMDADVWIENIPYTETRGYVQHILEHMVAFASVRGAEPPRLDILLSDVEPAMAPL
ncbi:MAG TPA: transglycosylase SLT domain-containing protein [Steroidobacteraceae bacterium]|jgi:soluble lytic murein transglycosylase|nr:transglycosylase SLT domain-containing protein [Steroidobacteraceae bacterium]